MGRNLDLVPWRSAGSGLAGRRQSRLAYLQRYGAHVRTAVFYSGSLLDVPLWQLAPVHAQQAFD